MVASRKQQQKVAASQNWPSVPAQITLAEVRERVSRDEEGNPERSYSLHVEYSYQVAGVTYQGDKITFGARKGYSSLQKAKDEIAPYPVDAQVRAVYNPENPKEAVLQQRAVGTNFMLIFGIIALLIALCSLCGVIWSLIGNLVSS